jgi:hypothetical protein
MRLRVGSGWVAEIKAEVLSKRANGGRRNKETLGCGVRSRFDKVSENTWDI